MNDFDPKLLIRSCVDRVPLCGCGSTEKLWAIVRDVLAVARDHSLQTKGAPSFYDAMPAHELPPIAVEFVAQVLAESGFLEHGTSIAWAWITDAGAATLAFLEEHGKDGWPDWATQGTMEGPNWLNDADWEPHTHAWSPPEAETETR